MKCNIHASQALIQTMKPTSLAKETESNFAWDYHFTTLATCSNFIVWI